jgi:low affinity Fe/Cu permease
MHLKLDELIRAIKGARNQLVNLEEMSDEELDKLQQEFHRVCGARKKGTKEMEERPAASATQEAGR